MENNKNPLTQQEIYLFKFLNEKKEELGTKEKMIKYLKTMMPFINKKESDANYYYFLYTINYRPEGDYENITMKDFNSPADLKQKRVANINSNTFTSAKIPFKGSNLEGGWDINNRSQKYYVVSSYGWYPIYLFINDVWYRTSNSYSNSTSKHLSQSNPIRYDSGIDNKVVIVTHNEMKKLIEGIPLESIKGTRKEGFRSTFQDEIGKKSSTRVYYNDTLYKANYVISEIKEVDGKFVFDIRITSMGKMDGRKLVKTPETENLSDELKTEFENEIFDSISDLYQMDVDQSDIIVNITF